MLVFTEIWLQELAQRYRDHKPHTKPFVYFVATEDKFCLMREQIEKWVVGLPEHLQNNVIGKLQAEENFRQTYHELVIGSLLRDLGLQTEYEKNFGELTPDWYVSPSDGSQAFIVEVLTENISASETSENKHIVDLQYRLMQIPLDVVLRIAFDRTLTKVKLNPQRAKKITREVNRWLEGGNSRVESELALDEFTFEVVVRDKGFSTLQFGDFGGGLCGDPTALRVNIKKKVHTYKTVAATNNIPLVVAVVADLKTNYGYLEMKRILFGKSFGQDLLSDGLFAKKPLLTGAIRAWSPQLGKWQMQYYFNPKAINPLPENLFNVL
jgi:hypothetical protein